MVFKRLSLAFAFSFILFACGNNPFEKINALRLAEGLPVIVDPGSSGGGLDSEEAAFLVLINGLRVEHGIASLSIEPHLQAASEAHSAYMNDQDTLTHSEPAPNTASWDRVENAGGSFSTVGENIACGNQDASATFTQWKNSPGHLANMLSSRYRFIGIARGGSTGEASAHSCPWYWTTDFGG